MANKSNDMNLIRTESIDAAVQYIRAYESEIKESAAKISKDINWLMDDANLTGDTAADYKNQLRQVVPTIATVDKKMEAFEKLCAKMCELFGVHASNTKMSFADASAKMTAASMKLKTVANK